MNMTEFFQSHHSKVTFLFLHSPFSLFFSFKQYFPVLYTTEIFRKLINLLYEGSWGNSSYGETILYKS